jgi:predicted nucleic acid-binding protein
LVKQLSPFSLVEFKMGEGVAHLDTNALIRALDKGETTAIDSALAGRTPVISITAAKEYLAKGDVNALRKFLSERGGNIGTAATEQEIQSLITQAQLMGRVLKSSDAAVAGSAIKEGASLITNDSRLAKFMQEAGYSVGGH